jgi:electron transfer flavoprotein beta subunit
MKLLVCIKQVPDMESRFKPAADGLWFDESDLAWRMNEYDEYAVEQAVQLKEQLGKEPELTVLSIGPDRVVEALKKALAMGGDRAVHIQDNAAHLKDPWQIASMISRYAGDKGFDLIFTGMQSQDRGSAQVGVLVAEMLGIASATTLVDFNYADGLIQGKRELEGGVKGLVELQLPALVTCQLGLNTPRYPTLPNIMKAKRKPIETIAADDLLSEGALAPATKFYAPERKAGGMVLEGDLSGMVEKLVGVLKEKTAVLR